MSHLTDVLILANRGEGDAIARVNAAMGATSPESSVVPFVRVPEENFAGNRRPCFDIWPGTFNYLDLELLLKAVRDGRWSSPECVQVFVRDEDDDIFSLAVGNMRPRVTHREEAVDGQGRVVKWRTVSEWLDEGTGEDPAAG
jgi:hypothetical protein